MTDSPRSILRIVPSPCCWVAIDDRMSLRRCCDACSALHSLRGGANMPASPDPRPEKPRFATQHADAAGLILFWIGCIRANQVLSSRLQGDEGE